MSRKYFTKTLCKMALIVVIQLITTVTSSAQIAHPFSSDQNHLEEERNKIRNQYNYLKENNLFTDYLDLGETVEFPIGIRKTIGNLEYIIAIDSIVITPTYAFLNASMYFIPADTDEGVAFKGTNIRFTQNGGIMPGARLELVGNYRLDRPGGNLDLILKGENTYVEWDCDGFKEFSIEGAIEFDRSVAQPINVDFEETEGNVTANFSVVIGDWNDIITTARITPFKLTKLEGFSFFVEDLLIDFSDFRNPGGVDLGSQYGSDYLMTGHPELWRGAYFNAITVYLPEQFTTENGDRPMINARDIWIDDFGLSGDFSAEYLMSLDEGESGSMKGWPFSIEKFEISLVANNLQYSAISGQLILPISGEETALNYNAFIDIENNYFFSIAAEKNLKFNIWSAGQVEIHKSSYINVEVVDGKFNPSAQLNGIMSIATPEKSGDAIRIPKIRFEQLDLSANAPYISGGLFAPESVIDQPGMAGFKLDITEIGIKNLENGAIALDINGGILLSGDAGGSFAANGGLRILGESNGSGLRQKWRYSKSEIKSISLNVDNGAMSLKGKLDFYKDDETYGNGFRGVIDAKFKPGVKVKAEARFGQIDGYKYWYADAIALFGNPIPIATGLGIYGFGGGASYHMKRLGGSNKSSIALSGLSYRPDLNVGLNLKAAVKLGTTPNPKAFNGQASFEVSFFNTGGMRNLNFKGEGTFMSLPLEAELSELKDNLNKISAFASNQQQPEGILSAGSTNRLGKDNVTGHININYDFNNKVLHGNVEVFVNAGRGMLQGVGKEGRAGWAVLHFAPAEWYIHIGTPTDRIGLRVGVGKIYANANGYFMAGTNIPASPPPNANVSRILGGINLDYMRDENALGLGSGFALGASLEFDTGDLAYWKFYARFLAGAGFDIMLKNYGAETACENREGPIGINGWYANGQAYAFFDGKIGIMVDIFEKRQKIDIINIAAATVLQAKLPNPVWMRGVVGGYFSALGGLVKGDCRFEVTIGEECSLADGSAISGIEVIADLTPAQDASDISVFVNPQAVFNLPVGEIFELSNFDNVTEYYRIKLDHFRAIANNDPIPIELDWNSNKDVVILRPLEILPPETEIRVEVQISYEKRIGGHWNPVTLNGNIIVENKEVQFNSGTAPDFIPASNIAYAYPYLGMKNFYPEEYNQGYLKLKKGQSYLFNQGADWQQIGKLISSDNTYEFKISYDQSIHEIRFNLPKTELGEDYSILLINSPPQGQQMFDENIANTETTLDNSQNVTLNTKSAEGSVEGLQETVIFSYDFSVSQYPTFNEKMADLKIQNTFRILLAAWDTHNLTSNTTVIEEFNTDELDGVSTTNYQAMVRLEAVVQGSKYFQQKIKPLIYDNYPIDGSAYIKNRELEVFGFIPSKAVRLANQSLTYELPIIYREDFVEIRSKVIPLYIYKPSPLPTQVNNLLFNPFPTISEGDYQVKFSYYLPGMNQPNSSFIVPQNLKFF